MEKRYVPSCNSPVSEIKKADDGEEGKRKTSTGHARKAKVHMDRYHIHISHAHNRDEVGKIGFIGGNQLRDPQKPSFRLAKGSFEIAKKKNTISSAPFSNLISGPPVLFCHRLNKTEVRISSGRLKHSLTPK